jgi:phage anti-repressor protein
MGNTTAVQGGAQQLVRVFDGVIGGMPAQVCDGRELHLFLKNGKQFSDWIKQRIGQYGFEENQDFVIASPKSEAKRGGHNRTDYHLTLDMAKELSMVENNDQGRQARRYFIEMERRAHAQPQQAEDEPAIEQLGLRGCNVLVAHYGEQMWFSAGNLSTALGLGSSDRLVRSLTERHKRKLKRGTRELWMIDVVGADRAADYCKPDVATEYKAWLQRVTGPTAQTLAGSPVERFGLEQLLDMRLLVSFDERGTYQAKPIPPGALLVSPSRLASVLSDPFTVPTEFLPEILQAVAARMGAAMRPGLPAA